MMTCSILPKHSSSLHWNTSPATVALKGITVNWNLWSSLLKVVKKDEAPSNCWWQNPFLQSPTAMKWASTRKCAKSPGVLKWYVSWPIALFKLVGSKQILSLSLPSLSLLSTGKKLFIHGDAWCTGFRILHCSILLISCLNCSLRWIGTSLHGVCLGWCLYQLVCGRVV